jgi:hypothetical protein
VVVAEDEWVEVEVLEEVVEVVLVDQLELLEQPEQQTLVVVEVEVDLQ